MQSPDFVEGVSGWRMSCGRIELYGALYPITLGKLETPEPEHPAPFFISGGVTYISQAEIKLSLESRPVVIDEFTAQFSDPELQKGLSQSIQLLP